MTGLRLIAAGHTRALRRAVFGGDDDLDEGGRNAAQSLAAALTGTSRTHPTPGAHHGGAWVCAPSRAARQTVHALGGPTPTEEHRLADPDYGTWTGHTLTDPVFAEDGRFDLDSQLDLGGRFDLGSWLTDPAATPHGGESLAAVRHRAGTWLDEQAGRTLTAVAHPTTVRAALAHALDLPADGIWRLDVAPLAVCRLTHRTGRWHLSLPA